jgi:hypothetical protein
MNNKTAKFIKKHVRQNYNDLIRRLFQESFKFRLKFAWRLLFSKNPFEFDWSDATNDVTKVQKPVIPVKFTSSKK